MTAPLFSTTLLTPRNEGRCNHMDLKTWINLFRAASQREEGQTMAEYGVVLAVITVGIVAALGALALAISGKLGNVTKVLGSSL